MPNSGYHLHKIRTLAGLGTGCLLLALLATVFALCPTSPVFADGGAPNLAYIGGSNAGVSILDVAQQRMSSTIAMQGAPSMMQLNADGSRLYAVQPITGLVTIQDLRNKKTLCTGNVSGHPSFILLSKQEEALFLASTTSPDVAVIDPQNCKQLRTIHTPSPVYGMALSLAGGAFPTHTGLYQLCVSTSDSVLIFDSDGTTLGSIPVSAGPAYLTAPQGFTLYATTRQGTVVAISLSQKLVSAPLLSNGRFGSMDFNEVTGEIYIPDLNGQMIDVLSAVAANGQQLVGGQVLRRIPTSSPPTNIAITNDGQLGFVALQNGQVMMLDIPGRQTIHTFTVGGQPTFIITGVYPPAPIANSQPGPTSTAASSPPPLLLISIGMFFISLIALLAIAIYWLRQHQKRSKQ